MAERAYIVTKGVVLRETETKEADKILTLLTADRGKISVIARGVRRKSCKYAACAQQLVYSEWTLYQKGEWYYANEGATAELFNGLRTNLEALALGCYFAELTETVTAPEVPAGALLPHLLNGLYALSALQKPPALVKPAFEIKLLCLAGYEPLADSCAYCGRPDPEQPLLDVVQGILRCRSCGAKESALSMPLCPDSLAALRHIVYGDPKRLYSFRLTGPALERLSAAAEAFVAAQLDHAGTEILRMTAQLLHRRFKGNPRPGRRLLKNHSQSLIFQQRRIISRFNALFDFQRELDDIHQFLLCKPVCIDEIFHFFASIVIFIFNSSQLVWRNHCRLCGGNRRETDRLNRHKKRQDEECRKNSFFNH